MVAEKSQQSGPSTVSPHEAVANAAGVSADQIPTTDGTGARASVDENHRGSWGTRNPEPPKVEKVMEKAEREAQKSQRHGANEEDVPERRLAAVRSPSADRSEGYGGTTLPVVEEVVGENQSTGGRSGGSRERREERDGSRERSRLKPNVNGAAPDAVTPLPPLKDGQEMTTNLDDAAPSKASHAKGSGSLRGRPSSTATVEERQKPLPSMPPPAIAENYTTSPSPARFRKSGDFEEMEMRVQRVDSDHPSAH